MNVGYLCGEDDVEAAMDTGLECACCIQDVEASEDVIFLQIVQTQNINEKFECLPILKPSDGDYQFSPIFVHLDGCWKDVIEGIHDKVEDTPPVEDPFAVLECSCCHSGIRELEYFALGQMGEFYCSPHRPGNQPVHTFQPWKGRDETLVHICLACITKISEDTLCEWNDVSQVGECVFCTHARCWRDGRCSCFCHMDGSDEG